MAATKKLLSGLALLLYALNSFAAVLPEERADVLYHKYDGGGVTVDGPSYLVRKNFKEKVSVSANYYVDMVSSASIDVLATASEYTEERTETSFTLDYLRDKSLLGISYTNSNESDYIANTMGFNLSQDFFGDLSTITMGFSIGDDTVKQNGNDSFEASATRRRYSVGFSQILTRKLMASVTYETVLDEGFLNNPYRQVRYRDSDAENGYSYLPEEYPDTRNSNAFAIKSIYYIAPFNASLMAEYRDYSDSWEITATNIKLRYAQNITPNLLVEARYGTYDQSQAEFYSDLFPELVGGSIPQTFYARDKELSEFSSQQFGLGLTYTFKSRYRVFNNSTINFYWDHLDIDYNNFRDVTAGGTAGEEPAYSLEADVFRIFFSSFF